MVPLSWPQHASVTVPGSKSITNRALILAALAGGETALQGALWSEDTQVMVEALKNDELVHEAPAIVGCQTPSALAHSTPS